MCLGIPAKVTSIDEATFAAEVDIVGNKKTISVMLTPQAKVGSWVLIHAGQAISVMSDEDAQESLAVWEEILRDGAFE